MRSIRPLARSLVPLLAASVVLAGCGDDSTSPSGPSIRDYLTSVTTQSGTVTATYRAGEPPAATASGPMAQAQPLSAPIVGGPAQVRVTGSGSFSRVIVTIDGVPGYYELVVPSNDTATIILNLSQDLPAASFTLGYAVGESASSIGTYDEVPVAVMQAGTGDVQVSLAWDTQSDVDLHVVDPTGEEVYYGNSIAASGGELDIDSNAGCSIDGRQVENITWPTGEAPRGTYTVRVDYWDSCGVAATNYVVTVKVKGKNPQTFTGSFTGPGDQGGAGDGRTITTFTY